MRKIITLLTVLLVSSLVMGQNQERLSVHFFDVPQNLESEFLKFNSEVNKTLENAGYGKNFYKLYRVKNSDQEKTLRYFQISSYTSDKHYEMTHDVGKEYEDLWNEMWDSEIGKKVWTFDNKTHIYRKVFRVEN
ncbi:hypothetical protein DEJ39_04870 [Bacteroidetes bacterium SCGC AAA795-G10]|nr:hypothetical protein DEJ39_04870 [Bacteroidetes bacterium SCGC AAA795-G10]|tara:strand:- start:9 stop:410 length:402 start_codon:yes stop_codon:yes gene_type:complete